MSFERGRSCEGWLSPSRLAARMPASLISPSIEPDCDSVRLTTVRQAFRSATSNVNAVGIHDAQRHRVANAREACRDGATDSAGSAGDDNDSRRVG